MVKARSMLPSLTTLALFFLRTVKAECITVPKELGHSVILSSEAVLQNEFPEASTLTLECDNGYVPQEGSHTITCVNGSWTEVELRCTRKNCGHPRVIPHITFIYLNGENATYFRDRITAVCEPGFQLVGSSHWQCLNHGWKGKSSCSVIVCGEARPDTFPALENGHIVTAPFHKEYVQFGDSIQYGCNDDYHLTGNPNITCTERGFTDLPKCERQVFSQYPSQTPMSEEIKSSVPIFVIPLTVVAVAVVIFFGFIWYNEKNKGSYNTQEA